MIENLTKQLCDELAAIEDLDAKIDALNTIRAALHAVSPFRDQPVDLVTWVKGDCVIGNDYNPNKVAKPEMDLLYRSIKADGYTQPIVSFRHAQMRMVVDGFHRNRVGKENGISAKSCTAICRSSASTRPNTSGWHPPSATTGHAASTPSS